MSVCILTFPIVYLSFFEQKRAKKIHAAAAGSREIGLAVLFKCLHSHLRVAGLILTLQPVKAMWDYAAPVRLCMIDGSKQASSLDENVCLQVYYGTFWTDYQLRQWELSHTLDTLLRECMWSSAVFVMGNGKFGHQ